MFSRPALRHDGFYKVFIEIFGVMLTVTTVTVDSTTVPRGFFTTICCELRGRDNIWCDAVHSRTVSPWWLLKSHDETPWGSLTMKVSLFYRSRKRFATIKRSSQLFTYFQSRPLCSNISLTFFFQTCLCVWIFTSNLSQLFLAVASFTAAIVGYVSHRHHNDC